MITCRALDALIPDYIDNKLTMEKQALFDEHLENCPVCREYLASYTSTLSNVRRLFFALQQTETEDAPVDVTQESPALLVEAVLSARRRNRERVT